MAAASVEWFVSNWTRCLKLHNVHEVMTTVSTEYNILAASCRTKISVGVGAKQPPPDVKGHGIYVGPDSCHVFEVSQSARDSSSRYIYYCGRMFSSSAFGIPANKLWKLSYTKYITALQLKNDFEDVLSSKFFQHYKCLLATKPYWLPP